MSEDSKHVSNALREVGHHTTRCVPFAQSLDDYIESFHTRNCFSRERMLPERAADFDQALRALVLPYCPSGVVQGENCTTVVWGLPSAAYDSRPLQPTSGERARGGSLSMGSTARG
jgi:hypothetical protein